MTTKKRFMSLYGWETSLGIDFTDVQVNIYEDSTHDGETSKFWIVVDRGEQLDWLIDQLQKIQKEE